MRAAAALLLGTLALVVPVDARVAAAPANVQSAYEATQPAATARNAVIGRRVLGRTTQGRPIRAWHLGDPQARWTVVAVGAMHGNERQSLRPLRHLRDHRPIRGVDLWVVPVMNPDGLRSDSRKNARGVDLNRNFPVSWRDLDGDYESGPRPASEPETRAMMRFLRSVDPDRVISLHQPFFAVDAKDSKRPRWSRRVAREMRIPLANVDCNGKCHGTMTQWFNRRLAGASITVELPAVSSRHYLTAVAPNGLLRSVGGQRGRRSSHADGG